MSRRTWARRRVSTAEPLITGRKKHAPTCTTGPGGEPAADRCGDRCYKSILNTPYHGGHFYAETQDGTEFTSKLFRISAADGKLVDVIDFGRPISSCATCIIAHGTVLSGDLHADGIVATQIAEHSQVDWPGPFGDRQTNQLATDADTNEELAPMRELSDEYLISKSEKP